MFISVLGGASLERNHHVSGFEPAIVRRISSESDGTSIRFVTMPRVFDSLVNPMPASQVIHLFEPFLPAI
jgi:hypothetical protein